MIADNSSILRNSDAHYLEDIGSSFSIINLKELDFNNLRYALLNNQVES